MVEELLDDTKLIKVPKALANQLKLVSGRLGTNTSDFATEALTQALRVDDMGSNLETAVDMYELVQIHKGAGLVNLPRTMMNECLVLDPSKECDKERFLEAGKWYAAFISSKLSSEQILSFLENDLLVFWNLDEVEIVEEDVVVDFRATSFSMSISVTEMFVLYTRGIFTELGYSETEKDVLPGLVSLKFLKTLK